MLQHIREFLESQAGMTLFLFMGLLVFAFMCIFVTWVLPTADKLYALLAGFAGTFNGGLLMYIRLKKE